MKTPLLSLAVIYVAFLSLDSCGVPASTPTKKDVPIQGETKGRIYTNDYFGITVEGPSNWFLKSFKAPKRKKPFQIDLFQTMQYPPDSNYMDNGNLYIAAELKNHNPLMEDGEDYLMELRDGLEMIALEGDQIGEIKADKVNGKAMYCLETYSLDTNNDLETHQKYYATLIKDYWILITLTYYDDDQKTSLEKCLSGIKFR